MRKSLGIVASIAALSLVFVSGVPANAAVTPDENGVATVANYAEFIEALDNGNVATISLGNNITVPEKVNILRSVTINGNGKTINIEREATWNSRFLQVYAQVTPIEVTMRDVTFTGGDLSVYVNGGTLNLEGTINLSGNYGGIGIAQGGGVTAVPSVNFADGVKVTYADEGHETPDGVPAPAIYSEANDFEMKFDGVNAAVYNVGKNQDFLYFNADNAPSTSDGTFTPLDVNDYRVNAIADEQEPTDPETGAPETTQPTTPTTDGKQTESDAEIAAPNTGTTIANVSIVVVGAIVAILTAVYATRFAGARK